MPDWQLQQRRADYGAASHAVGSDHPSIKSRCAPAARHVAALLYLLISPAPFSLAATPLWWDTSYQARFEIAVSVGANTPDKGYGGYTARIPSLDTQSLIAAGDMRADCRDLRVAYYDGLYWQELPRHVIGCNTPNTDIRFALVAGIAAGGTDDSYYLYHHNPAAPVAPAVTPTNVYLWYDDAAVNRLSNYTRGRVDAWHGTGWDNSLAWNAAGYYTYDTGDNFTSGYRRAVDERDVYVEAEFFHTGCYQLNMTTGVLVRGIVASGSGGSESSNHYYASNRGEYPGCSGSGYGHDGDVLKNQRTTTAVDGPDPGDVVANAWRRQGLAAWLVNPTNLAFWDEDTTTNWAALGFPDSGNLQASGTDASDNEGRGFAGVMTAQDMARLRNVLIRRYVDPEPTLALTAQVLSPSLVLTKTLQTTFDPYSGGTNPKAIPGGFVEYTITADNAGPGTVDANTLVVTEPVPADASLYVGDLGAAGSGPVIFADGSGAAASGLSYTFTALGSPADDLAFSTDGSNFNYTPIPDVDGFDPAVRFVRVSPTGVFAAPSGVPRTTFDLRFRIRID